MRPFIHLPVLFKRLLVIVPFIFAFSLHGCALMNGVPLKSTTFEGVPEERIERNDFSAAKEDDVVGQPAFVTLRKGDTPPDIARHFKLGHHEGAGP